MYQALCILHVFSDLILQKPKEVDLIIKIIPVVKYRNQVSYDITRGGQPGLLAEDASSLLRPTRIPVLTLPLLGC